MNTNLMKIPDLLADFASKDITVWVDGDRLHCDAPAGALTPEYRDQLRDRKSEIIRFLNMAAATARQQPAIVPLQPHGRQTPIYAVPGHDGAAMAYSDLSRHLGDDQPFFALEPPGLDGRTEPKDSIEDIAEYFANQILEFQPVGPYVLAGYCSGAAVALELAQRLVQRGAEVRCVAFFGPLHPSTYQTLPRLLLFYAIRQVSAVAMHLRHLAKLPSLDARVWYLTNRLRKRREGNRARLAESRTGEEPAKGDPVLARRERLKVAILAAFRRYAPAPYSGRLCLFLPNRAYLRSGTGPLRWLRVAPHAEVYYGPKHCYGPHMLQEPYVPAIAELYRQSVRRSERAFF